MKKFLLSLLIIPCLTIAFTQKPVTVMDTYSGESAVGQRGITCTITDPILTQAPNGINGIFSDLDCVLCMTGLQVLAEKFTLDQNTTVTTLCYYGGYYPSNINQDPDDFTVTYYADAAGIPGTVVGGPFNLTVSSKSTTGVILLGVDEYKYEGTHPPVNVTAGTTYHIEIYNNTVGNADQWIWEAGTLDPTTGVDGMSFHFADNLWSQSGPGTNLAVTIGARAEVVPTLGEWAIIILGMSFLIIGVVVIRYRKRQTSVN